MSDNTFAWYHDKIKNEQFMKGWLEELIFAPSLLDAYDNQKKKTKGEWDE